MSTKPSDTPPVTPKPTAQSTPPSSRLPASILEKFRRITKDLAENRARNLDWADRGGPLHLK